MAPHASPESEERGAVKAALLRYTKKEGCFAYKDEEGKTKDFWEDSFITKVAPWDWWKEVAAVEEPMLYKLAWRVLQIGVASSVNERIFSGWGHILGKRRNKMSKKRQLKEVQIAECPVSVLTYVCVQVNIYTNRRVMKKRRMSDQWAPCDPSSESEVDDP